MKNHCILLVILLMFYPATGISEEDVSAWFSFGFGSIDGVNSKYANNEIGVMFRTFYQPSRKYLASFRILSVGGFLSDKELTEIGLLFGMIWRQGSSNAYALAGVGVSNFFPDIPDFEDQSQFGMPIELGIAFNPSRYFGISLKAQGNINSLEHYGGYCIALEFGRFGFR